MINFKTIYKLAWSIEANQVSPNSVSRTYVRVDNVSTEYGPTHK